MLENGRRSYNFQFKVILGIWTLNPQQNRICFHRDKAQSDIILFGVWLIASGKLILNKSTTGTELVSNWLCMMEGDESESERVEKISFSLNI